MYGEFAQKFQIIVGHAMETGTLEKRIIIQKIAYLLYRKGVNFEYTDFSWYLHGIFSWNLWYDIIHFWDPAPQLLSTEQVASVNNVLEDFKKANLTTYFTTSNDLELITTILYRAKSQSDLNSENTSLINEVIALKGKFSQEQIKIAIDKIKLIEWNFN
ncbi:MAG: hypothetical protein ACREBF_01160 [Candidatus Micrarchaeales archaeon]